MTILKSTLLMGVTALTLAACADDTRRVESSPGYSDSSYSNDHNRSESTVRGSQSK